MDARGVRNLPAAAAVAILLALAACQGEAPEPEAEQTEIPEELQSSPERPEQVSEEIEGATPMGERMATIGVVNKRNNISQDIEMLPGESRRLGDVIVKLEACERTAPWEDPVQTAGFVQVFVNERQDAGAERAWFKVHSGWLYKENPSLNVVEHPVYDVWFKECEMSFPGEEPVVSES